MIPADVANALRLQLPDHAKIAAEQPQNQPVAAAQRITDVLSDLVPGQRIFAEIQALLPNGTYRAVVAQRDVTLSLPFSAKPGDSLELEVTETDGQVTLAFVAKRGGAEAAQPHQESVPTTLSRTGQLIGDLIGESGGEGKRAPPIALNGSQPLVESMPAKAADLAPVLKQALTQSGMFYEAHQARWVAGEMPTEALLQEPQGRLSTPLPATSQPVGQPVTNATPASSGPNAAALPQGALAPGMTAAIAPEIPGGAPLNEALSKLAGLYQAVSPDSGHAAADETPALANSPPEIGHALRHEIPTLAASRAEQAAAAGAQNITTVQATNTSGDNRIPQELTPVVRQQLDGLATNQYAWQGQIWPEQTMWWEIAQEQHEQRAAQPDEPVQWRSRLKLTLPNLGEIDASLQLLAGGAVALSLTAGTPETEERLRQKGDALIKQFSAAGLDVAGLQFQHASPEQ